jgi:O-antigen ligase
MTFNYLAKFLIPFPFFMVGYSIINTNEKYLYFIRQSYYLLGYFVLYIIYCSIFSIGNRFYAGIAGNLRTGYMGLQGLYIPTFLIIQGFFFFKYFKGNSRSIITLLLIMGLVIFILIFKRTNIILLGLGISMWLIYDRKEKTSTKLFQLFLIFITISITFRTEEFEKVFSARESRFSSDYNIMQEGRYKENAFIWDQINDNILTILFGSGEVFNDGKTMSEKADFVGRRGRQAHNSYARLLWSGGIIGLLLFLSFYFRIWQKIKRNYKRKKVIPDDIYRTVFIWSLVFIILRLINDLSSGITYITFNTFFYTQLGSLLHLSYDFQRPAWYKIDD